MTLTTSTTQPLTLDSLLASMRSGALSGCDADWTDLSNYGGTTPENTVNVWSWDETRLLVGDCSANLEIVDRADCTWTR
jgi:hypothetical protein